MALAFFVYLGLMLALIAAWFRPARMVAGGMSVSAMSAINWATMISITLFTLLIGGRYNVGGDFINYLDMYRFTTVGASNDNVFVEPGFLLMMQFLKLLGMPERSVIVASSLIQIILFSLWLRKHPQIAPFAVFGFTTLLLLDVNNIIRQGVAFFATSAGSSFWHGACSPTCSTRVPYLSFRFVSSFVGFHLLKFSSN